MPTWVPIFEEIGRRILDFEDRQNELIELTREMGRIGLMPVRLTDKGPAGEACELDEIDPFTFMANFNRGIKTQTRIATLQFLKERWGLEAEAPVDFDGVPIVQNTASWFFAYKADRLDGDIPTLWKLARQAVESDPGSFVESLIDDAIKIKGVAIGKATMGMFWVNPKQWVSADGNNRAFFAKRGITLAEESGQDYVAYRERIIAELGGDFVELSAQAYAEAMVETEAAVATIKEEPKAIQYWTMSAGEGGEKWREFHDAGEIAIDYGLDQRDLRSFENQEEIAALLRGDTEKSHTNDSKACWQFVHDLRMGDIVFVKQGGRRLMGVCRVTGDYEFSSDRPDYFHRRAVKWLKVGSWALEEGRQMAIKTLTRPTNSTGLVDRLIEIVGGRRDSVEGIVFDGGARPDKRNYWWLNANPKMWDFATLAVGGTQTYTAYNEKGNKRRIFKYFEEVKPGDVVVGYHTTPDLAIVALGEFTKGMHDIPAKGGQGVEFKKTENVEVAITWAELKEHPDLKDCEPIINNQGSLFRLSAEEFETIQALIDEKNLPVKVETLEPYSREDALKDLFLNGTAFDTILGRLLRKKNIILQGPPGTGKTFVAKRIAYCMMGVKDPRRVESVQFHQSYSYEDFVQGYRPNETGGFLLKNGVFFEFCKRAQRDPDNDYFFIIDEINRGNLSKILGELMTLIEADKRGKEFAVPLTYSRDVEDRFWLPERLHIIGAMNTADRSLAMVDYALRRRFGFVDVTPGFDSPNFEAVLGANGVSQAMTSKIRDRLRELNKIISSDTKNLGRGFEIGHSYFCPTVEIDGDESAWFAEVIDSEVRPLLEEYWIDEPERVSDMVKKLLA